MAAGIPEGGFRNRNSLEAWLERLPDADRVLFSQIIAQRAAMRVLPLVGRTDPAAYHRTDRFLDLTLAVFRATLISRVALKIPTREIRLAAATAATAANAAAAATAAANAAANATTAAATAAAYAATAAAYAATAAAAAATAAAYAATAAAYAATAAAAIWDAIDADARRLVQGGVDRLAGTPLWPGAAPAWWTRSCTGMQQNLRALDTSGSDPVDGSGWQLWIDWYTARAAAKAPWGVPESSAEQLEMRIALGDGRDDFWGSKENPRGAELVNAEIAGWVEAARVAQKLALAQHESLGSNWGKSGDHLEMRNEVAAGDVEVARNPVTQRAHQSLLRKALKFGDAACGFDELYGWTGFGDDYNRLTTALQCEGDGLADQIWDIYDATLTVASYLQQDNDIRGSSPAFSNAALSAAHRREFIDLVRSLAPWVRRFPTARQEDEGAANFLQRVSDQLTNTLLESAHQKGVITDKDRELIKALLAAMERNGLPAEKAGIRAHFSVRNLTFAGAMFIAGSVASGTMEKSELHGKITDWMAERVDEITEIVADAPDDIQVIIKDILADIASREPGGDDGPDIPTLPDGGSPRRRRRS
ncbi:hypothetical protein [Hoeflea sp.]|uniref:hypothetical protein n=1 Tax=Hoeflea sp. TaxID=1940281 RepID=UPI0037494EB0